MHIERLQEALGSQLDITNATRSLIKEGVVRIIKSKREKREVVMYLLNDMILLTKPKDNNQQKHVSCYPKFSYRKATNTKDRVNCCQFWEQPKSRTSYRSTLCWRHFSKRRWVSFTCLNCEGFEQIIELSRIGKRLAKIECKSKESKEDWISKIAGAVDSLSEALKTLSVEYSWKSSTKISHCDVYSSTWTILRRTYYLSQRPSLLTETFINGL